MKNNHSIEELIELAQNGPDLYTPDISENINGIIYSWIKNTPIEPGPIEFNAKDLYQNFLDYCEKYGFESGPAITINYWARRVKKILYSKRNRKDAKTTVYLISKNTLNKIK